MILKVLAILIIIAAAFKVHEHVQDHKLFSIAPPSIREIHQNKSLTVIELLEDIVSQPSPVHYNGYRITHEVKFDKKLGGYLLIRISL